MNPQDSITSFADFTLWHLKRLNKMEVLSRLKANEQLLLDDQELVWVVKSGSLSLFATKVKSEMPVGNRRKEADQNEHRRYLF